MSTERTREQIEELLDGLIKDYEGMSKDDIIFMQQEIIFQLAVYINNKTKEDLRILRERVGEL